MNSASDGSGELQTLTRALREASEIMTIGAPEGDKGEMIGEAADVAIGENGQMYVLDSRYNEVKMYDAEGRFEEAFGEPGRGPEEFMAPRHLELDVEGRLVVADRMAPFKVFEPKGTSYEYRSSISITTTPEGLCVMNGLIYWQGSELEEKSEESGTIRAVSEGGELVDTFGSHYKSDNALLRSQLSAGTVTCSADAQTVVMGFNLLPMLYGYSAEGDAKWVSKFSDFKQGEVREVERGGRRGVANDPTPTSTGGESDVLWSLARAPNGHVVAQLARRDEASIQARQDYAKLHTYVIDGRTGEGVYVGDLFPKIYQVTGRRVYAGRNNPFPQIVVYELKESRVGV
jgi:hypothetical protein